MNKNILWIDTETTNLDLNTGQIIQISAKLTDSKGNSLEEDGFTSYIKLEQDSKIDILSMVKTGLIHKVNILKKSEPGNIVFDKFIKQYTEKKKLIFGGYNVNFDFNYVQKWFDKNKPNKFKMFDYANLDVFQMILLVENKLDIEFSHKRLVDMYNFFKKWLNLELTEEQFHDAEVDILMTIELYKLFNNILTNDKLSNSIKESIQSAEYQKYLVNDNFWNYKREGSYTLQFLPYVHEENVKTFEMKKTHFLKLDFAKSLTQSSLYVTECLGKNICPICEKSNEYKENYEKSKTIQDSRSLSTNIRVIEDTNNRDNEGKIFYTTFTSNKVFTFISDIYKQFKKTPYDIQDGIVIKFDVTQKNDRNYLDNFSLDFGDKYKIDLNDINVRNKLTDLTNLFGFTKDTLDVQQDIIKYFYDRFLDK